MTSHMQCLCVVGGSASGSEIDTEDELEQARKVTLAGSDDFKLHLKPFLLKISSKLSVTVQQTEKSTPDF